VIGVVCSPHEGAETGVRSMRGAGLGSYGSGATLS
jgi:hypothetical protein